MKKAFLLILAALTLSCLAESPELTPTQTPTISATPTPTSTHVTPTPSAVVTPTTSPTLQIPTPTPSETPAITPAPTLEFGVKYPAKVIYVYDGDIIKVNLSGQILIIRLLGVDTPEKSAEKNKPYEYDAITNLTYLAEWGIKAKNFAYEMLYNRTVYIEFDEVAGLKGYYGRYLAYVYVNGTDFNALLVKKGRLARVYKEGKCKKEAYYLQLEEIARSNKTGLWRVAE